MLERRWQPADPELEQALVELAAGLVYPPTPELARRVAERLSPRPTPRPAVWDRLVRSRRLAFGLLAIVAFCFGLLALSPEARTALAERLGLRGIGIFHVPAVPEATPSPSPAPSPPPAGARLGLGQRLTLAEVQARAPFPLLVPTLPDLGQPDEIYFGEPPLGGQVSLVWRARPGLPMATGSEVGLLLTQFRGDLDPVFINKSVGPGTRLEAAEVHGQPAFWLEGRPHLFIYRDRAGRVADEQVRLAGNVLLWEQGELTLRLESALTQAEALRIAASLR